eukprot:SAG22_NODE_1019_length_6003_cov_12.659722_1_plen_97_part_00
MRLEIQLFDLQSHCSCTRGRGELPRAFEKFLERPSVRLRPQHAFGTMTGCGKHDFREMRADRGLANQTVPSWLANTLSALAGSWNVHKTCRTKSYM